MRPLAHPNRVTLQRPRKAVLIGINYDAAPEASIERLKLPQSDTEKVLRLLKGEISPKLERP
jgi:hypothetical protein